MYSHCREADVKYGLLSKHLFQKKQQFGNWENQRVTLNFRNIYKKMFSSYHIKYKHSLVEFVSIIYILIFFEAATFEVSWAVYFQTI